MNQMRWVSARNLAWATLGAAAAGSAVSWVSLWRVVPARVLLEPPVGAELPASGLLWTELALWGLAALPLGFAPLWRLWDRLSDPVHRAWSVALLPASLTAWIAIRLILGGRWEGVLLLPLAIVLFGWRGRALARARGLTVGGPLAVGLALTWRYLAMAAPITVLGTGWGAIASLAATLPPYVLVDVAGEGGLATLADHVPVGLFGAWLPLAFGTAMLPLGLGCGAVAFAVLLLLPGHVARRAWGL